MAKMLIALLILLGSTVEPQEPMNSKEANPVIVEVKKPVPIPVKYEVKSEISDKKVSKPKSKKKESESSKYSNIPLDKKIIAYAVKQSEEYDFSVELLFALMKVESNFNPIAVSSTNDVGLTQINKRTAKWIASQLGVSKYNLKNPYTSIDFSLFYLNYLRDKLRSKGLSEEMVFEYTVISYNRGEAGAKRYIRKYGTENNSYLNKVIKAKIEIEDGNIGQTTY